MHLVIHYKKQHEIGVIITCHNLLTIIFLNLHKCSKNVIARCRMINKSTWNSRISNRERLNGLRCIMNIYKIGS